MQVSPVELYRRAANDAVAVVSRIAPDQLVAPTPCESWSVRDIVERGRAAGIVGPAVPVAVGASPQARLLGAMGRQP